MTMLFKEKLRKVLYPYTFKHLLKIGVWQGSNIGSSPEGSKSTLGQTAIMGELLLSISEIFNQVLTLWGRLCDDEQCTKC